MMNNNFFEEQELTHKINDFKSVINNEFQSDSEIDYSMIFTEKELFNLSGRGTERKLFGKYLIKKIIRDKLCDIDLKQVEVLNNEKGKPVINTSEPLKKQYKKKGISNIALSISHSKNWITVLVVFEYQDAKC